jgi:tetratricopeptide (TPR) repeat protein
MIRHAAFLCLSAAILMPGFALARSTGENPLNVPRAEFRAAQEGLDLVYNRQYREALQHFERVGVDFPDSALGPVGREIAHQASMYESRNFDAERAYLSDAGDADALFRRGRRQSDRAAWNAFLLGVHDGLAALYSVRKGDNLAALNQAWDAIESMKKVERMAPEFHDVKLASGMYDYWRTVYTEKIDGLPNFGDKREQGLRLMRQAREQGLLAPAPASLVLTYSYMEKGDLDAALGEAKWVEERYPNNLLNLMVLAQVQRKKRLNTDAVATYQRAVEVAPEVPSTWYSLARQLERSRSTLKDARDVYKTYVERATTNPQKATGWYRMGMLERKLRRYESAKYAFGQANQLDPQLTKALERLAQVTREQTEAKEGRDRKRAERRSKYKQATEARSQRAINR